MTTSTTKRQNPIMRLLRAAANLIVLGATLWAVGVIVGLVGMVTVGNTVLPFNTFADLLPFLLLPSVVFLPLFFLFRRPRLALLHLPALAFLLVWYSVFFIPGAPTAPADVPTLRVMTYNLYAGNTNFNAATGIIQQLDADLVLLQEVTDAAAAAIAERLTGTYPHQALHPVGESVIGAGVISRFPIESDETWRPNGGLMQQRVEIVFDATPIVVYNAHPSPPHIDVIDGNTSERTRIIADLVTRTESETQPVILAGDFNTSDRSADYAGIVEAGFGDAFRVAGYGFGFTYPDYSFVERSLRPLQLARIDYIFYDESFVATNARVWEHAGGADHRPVVADLAFVGE